MKSIGLFECVLMVFFFPFLFQMTSANPEQFGAAMGNAAEYAQEEEWEREGLLDPAWEKQQRKVRNKNISLSIQYSYLSKNQIGDPFCLSVFNEIGNKVSRGIMYENVSCQDILMGD